MERADPVAPALEGEVQAMSRSGVVPPDSTFPQALAGRAPCVPPAVVVQATSLSAAIPCGVPAIGVVEVTVLVRGSIRRRFPG